MAQDYRVLNFKKGDFQDDNGNYWCSMALEGIGEPVRIAVKDPMQFEDGMTLYGSIETKVSKAGKDYLKFRRERKDEQQTFKSNDHKDDDAYWEDKNSSIKAQFAIKTAVQAMGTLPEGSSENYWAAAEIHAKRVYAMIDRVKASGFGTLAEFGTPVELTMAQTAEDAKSFTQPVRRSESTDPKATSQTSATQPTSSASPTDGVSGYDKFKASRPKTEDEMDAEAESLYTRGAEIDLSEIPF